MGEEEIKKQIRSYYGENGKGKYVKWLLILAVVLVVGFFIYTTFIGLERKPVCGDGICEADENCWDCPKDCSCGSDEYCSQETKTCESASCGNGECEPGESIANCCSDCGCGTEIEMCNEETQECYVPEANISDEFVREKVMNYYTSKGLNVTWINVTESTKIGDKSAKTALVNITGEFYLYIVAVTEDGEVVEYPRI